MKAMLVWSCLVLLGGCAAQPSPGLGTLFGAGACAKPDADQQLALNLADEMLNEGRPHAGLAHLEQLPDRLDPVRLRKAQVSRLLGRSEAEPLYRSLLGGCLAAQGEHGLGQLAAARGALRTAHRPRTARRPAPAGDQPGDAGAGAGRLAASQRPGESSAPGTGAVCRGPGQGTPPKPGCASRPVVRRLHRAARRRLRRSASAPCSVGWTATSTPSRNTCAGPVRRRRTTDDAG